MNWPYRGDDYQHDPSAIRPISEIIYRLSSHGVGYSKDTKIVLLSIGLLTECAGSVRIRNGMLDTPFEECGEDGSETDSFAKLRFKKVYLKLPFAGSPQDLTVESHRRISL